MVRDEHLGRSSARPASEWLRSEGGAEDGVGAGRAAGALAVALLAALLLVGPAAVAAVAMFAPGLLDRVATWLAGASLAFSIVAAGRVPAAAIFAALMMARKRAPATAWDSFRPSA